MKGKGLRLICLGAIISAVIAAGCFLLTGCKKDDDLKGADVSVPSESNTYHTREEAVAAGGGWYETMIEDFDSNTLPEKWNYSPHGLRNTEYWCDQTVSFEDGCLVVDAYKSDSHSCDVCPSSGEFTGGIETRYMDGEESVQTFSQAFGYYEVRCKLPRAQGMWAAFWLQSVNQGKIGNEGEDGTEIDVFESAFINKNPAMVGHALLYDGYADYGKVTDFRKVTDSDLYDGFHTYGLKWTPNEYIFYVDGKATWRTDFGGVSKVPEFLRLTCEIRHGYGPHGVKLKEFDSTEENPAKFYVDYVKVYQNTEYEASIKSDSDYKEIIPEGGK